MKNIHVGESIFKHETRDCNKGNYIKRDISGFRPLRWGEAIHQLVSITFNFTHSLSLGPGLYIFLHLHRLGGRRYFTPGRRMLWWKWAVRHIRKYKAHTAEDQFEHEAQLEPWFHLYHTASFTFLWLFQWSFHFSWILFMITCVQLEFTSYVLYNKGKTVNKTTDYMSVCWS